MNFNVIDWSILIFSWFFFSVGIFIIFTCFIGIIRFKDFFIKLHAIKISNIYGISLVLIAFAITSANLLVSIQLCLIIILNILSTLIISHTTARIALTHNISHGGFSRRKYNEMISEKEKLENEKREEERKKMMEEIERKKQEESNE